MRRKNVLCHRLMAMAIVTILCAVFVFVYEGLVRSENEPVSVQGRERDTSAGPGPTAITTLSTERPKSVLETHLLPNPPQHSRWAYTTLISGIDKSMRYKGFLLNCLIMHKALREQGSTADFIAMIGFRDEEHHLYIDDLNLLIVNGIIVHFLPRLVHEKHTLSFAEMALLKVTPYSFTQYEKVQFFDGDIMPTKNMDCYFSLSYNTFTVGAVSPLNSGWFLALPNTANYNYLVAQAVDRLGRDWDKSNGWGRPMPPGLQFRGSAEDHRLWDFNGADMDQGLFCDTFMLQQGKGILIDTEKANAKVFHKGLLQAAPEVQSSKQALEVCSGKLPTDAFVHFTGRSKPWMNDPQVKKRGRDWKLWMNHLDRLKLTINSSNILEMNLGSPLGFFNANFPKGGYTSTARVHM